MRKNLIIFAIIFGSFLAACNNKSTQEETPTAEAPTKNEIEEKLVLEPVPQDLGQKLTSNCTNVEITFYSVGASISSESCASFFGLIDNSVPEELIKEEFGHMLFVGSGDLISLAKIHLKDDKGYLKFQEGENFYYQNFNEQGVKFFDNIRNQQAPQ